MKRVSIVFLAVIIILTQLIDFLCIGGRFAQVIRVGYLCLYIIIGFVLFACCPRIVKRKIIKMRKETPGKNFLLYGEFFFPEIYLLDVENGVLVAWFMTNPLKLQHLDMKKVRSVELLKNIGSNGLIGMIRCRLYMEEGKHDMWVFRNARYGHKAWINQESGQEVLKLGEDLEEYCWLAIDKAGQRRY